MTPFKNNGTGVRFLTFAPQPKALNLDKYFVKKKKKIQLTWSNFFELEMLVGFEDITFAVVKVRNLAMWG